MIIEPGDFVDVTATLDIVSIGRKPKDRRTDIHFAFTRIIRLMSRDDLGKVRTRATDEYAPETDNAPGSSWDQ